MRGVPVNAPRSLSSLTFHVSRFTPHVSLIVAGALALQPRRLHEGYGFAVRRHDGVEIGGDVLETRVPVFVYINPQVAFLNVARRRRHHQRVADLMSIK